MVDSLLDLPPNTQWLFREEKGVRLRKVVGRIGKIEVPKIMVIALALADECATLGQGMVYFLQPHPRSDNNGSSPAFSFYDGFLEMKTVPQLMYIPKRWTTTEQEAWHKLTPSQQLYRLDSRHGWVSDFTAVLPLVVDHHDEQLSRPTFDGYTAAPVIVHLSTHFIVGPTADIRVLCERMWQGATSKKEDRAQQPKSTFFGAILGSWADFEQWDVPDLAGVITSLESCCRDIDADYVRLFGHLRLSCIVAAQQAHHCDQAYACRGTMSDWKKQ